jgi:predicted nucleic acid-binding Zn ribbon protein
MKKRRIIKYTKPQQSFFINEPKTLDSVLIKSLKSLNLDQKFNERLIIKYWGNMFGASIINATNNIVYKDNGLTIFLNSSVIKSELLMMKQQILEKFQEQFGKQNIRYLNIY